MSLPGASLVRRWPSAPARLRDAAALATSALATLVRLGSGARVGHVGARPERRLVLYEMEGCPYSRKVREALSVLDLDADVRPCPRGSSHHRAELKELIHVRDEVPVLVDPNTAEVLRDSDAIVAYLFSRYGDGRVPPALRLGPLTNASSKVASALRARRGTQRAPARRPGHELELWGFEASPACRLVRERLDELEIPYVARNAALGSDKRIELRARAGRVALPYLEDPETGARLSGTAEILRYLEQTYVAPSTAAGAVAPRDAVAAPS